MNSINLQIKVIMGQGRQPKEVAKELRSRMVEYASSVEESVRRIIDDVAKRGDDALIEYERKYGWVGCTAEKLRLSDEEINSAIASVDNDILSSLEFAKRRLEQYYLRHLPSSTIEFAGDGSLYAEFVRPIESLLIYVPGGRAVYPSTVLHVGVPAAVAGVPNIYITTPADEHGVVHPSIIAASKLIGAKAVFRVGGAHALAAFAFGTESIPKVDMIAGPGGSYVVAAKRLLFGLVGIDLLPGPSEVFVIADETADAEFVAIDMLAQSEHGDDSAAVLATPSYELLSSVHDAILRLLSESERREVVLRSLNAFGALILAESIDWALELCNEYAPEHVEVHCADALSVAIGIRNAGAIFIGGTPTACGDYLAGPSHVLPTLGAARYSSGLSVENFVRRIRCAMLSDECIRLIGEHAIKIAHIEGLGNHAKSIEARLERLGMKMKRGVDDDEGS
ncbi:MAG: histidinol dehydrogenase [Armatimonadota bacterium]|nr:histidinol dehydrogenase [Armatimonadota bacterium]MCX7778058.1 histidinol dehydrogenase [Armatimonadota bacterium]MDW8026058.1 histidinol dehydrogenase [Armatimonadota bacterium]